LTSEEIDGADRGDRVATDAEVCRWQLNVDTSVTAGLGDQVDDGIGGLHGLCVNQLIAVMTGWNWTGAEHHHVHAPDQYRAICFHEDSLDDFRWPESFSFTVPDDLPRGCYAMRLSEQRERNPNGFYVPFFVTAPPGRAHAPASTSTGSRSTTCTSTAVGSSTRPGAVPW